MDDMVTVGSGYPHRPLLWTGKRGCAQIREKDLNVMFSGLIYAIFITMLCTSLLSISLHHCNQEPEPKPGFVETSAHSYRSSHARADMG